MNCAPSPGSRIDPESAPWPPSPCGSRAGRHGGRTMSSWSGCGRSSTSDANRQAALLRSQNSRRRGRDRRDRPNGFAGLGRTSLFNYANGWRRAPRPEPAHRGAGRTVIDIAGRHPRPGHRGTCHSSLEVARGGLGGGLGRRIRRHAVQEAIAPPDVATLSA